VAAARLRLLPARNTDHRGLVGARSISLLAPKQKREVTQRKYKTCNNNPYRPAMKVPVK
jgi:hypothetical protein